MSRFARDRRVFFLEEPVFEESEPHMRSSVCPETGVSIHVPVLPNGLTKPEIIGLQRQLLASMIAQNGIRDHIAWYYTPMAREFSNELKPTVTIYDCMDELSAFRNAAPAMHLNEQSLFEHADLVFTGGSSLYESKRKQHNAVHLFPSSVEVSHFSAARFLIPEPADQAAIPQPRLGYAGVIDERMDLEILRAISVARPDWHLVLLGPIVKIDPSQLPQGDNIHYLGMKPYSQLPAYMAGWNIGLLPFALNDSTRFISPTKTPEYLAAGLRVVSTPIRDVVTPYGDLGLVEIAKSPAEFISAADKLLLDAGNLGFRERADNFLARSSWDKTWHDMNQLIEGAMAAKQFVSPGIIGANGISVGTGVRSIGVKSAQSLDTYAPEAYTQRANHV